MGLPSKRRTKTSKRQRASHFALKSIALSACANCKKLIPPHKACPFCGFYRGRKVFHVETLADRKKRREDRNDAKRNA